MAVENNAQYGCMSGDGCARGQQVLYGLVSGKIEGVPVSEVVASLTKTNGLNVTILGDRTSRVTLSFESRPLQLVLLDIEENTGVTLELPWLPRVKADEEISFCAVAKAETISRLLFALRGTEVQIPKQKSDTQVTLRLRNTTLNKAAEELQRAVK
jgi:hypothetical protein